MEKLRGSWWEHHERTKESPPSESLAIAMTSVTGRDAALDLGAGTLRDTKFLLQEGFRSVVAVDIEPSVQDRAKNIEDDRLRVVTASFQTFEFEKDAFDLVNAQNSLQFIPRESFDEVFMKIKGSLKEGGIFVGSLFGENDGWEGASNMTFLSLAQLQGLFSDMEIIELREEEKDAPTVAGSDKHWHIFHVIARK